MTKIKTYFSTFSGAEGFGIGIEKAIDGIELVGVSEIDKFASTVLKYKHPNVKNYGDITKIDWNTAPDFNLLVGGSPCQDLSIAGKRAGLDGKRSGLFNNYVEALEIKQPDYFIWENVKGALSSQDGWDFAEVLNSFSEAGYSFGWQVLNAKHFSVPQNRERIFVIGTRGERAREVFFDRQGAYEHTDQAIEQGVATTLTVRGAGGQNRRGNYIIQLNEPSHSNDRIYAVEGISPTLNTMQGGNRQPFIFVQNQRRELRSMDIIGSLQASQSATQFQYVIVPEATRLGYSIAKEGDSINLSVPNSKTRRGRIGHGIAQTLDTGMQQYTLQHGKVRRLTPTECERIMSWPDNHTKFGIKDGKVVEISDSQRYKMCGNGVVSRVVEEITRLLNE